MNVTATIVINDADHYARATFTHDAYPEPYAIYVETGNDTPYQLNDDSDADPDPCDSWDNARARFLFTVEDYIRDNIA